MSLRKSGHSVFLAILLAPVQAFAADDEAGAWLTRMATALREQNYSGIFSFMRGAEFNTMRIVHRYENGHETERILQLNGERRDITRVDDDVVCHHDGHRDVDLEHNVPLGPFSQMFNDNIANFQNQYRVSLRGEDRVADRPTVMLDIMPKGDDRYGYRLWLDRETGLLLQSHLVERQRVRELFQFAEIEIGGSIDDATVRHKLTADIIEPADRQPGLRVSWLPDGFRVIQATANQLHFSDGLANFSVFIERSKALPEMSTRVGGTTVITRTLKGAGQVTVIGEVPVATARRVAESVEPVIY